MSHVQAVVIISLADKLINGYCFFHIGFIYVEN